MEINELDVHIDEIMEVEFKECTIRPCRQITLLRYPPI